MTKSFRHPHWRHSPPIVVAVLLSGLLRPPPLVSAELTIVESVAIDFGGVVADSGTVRLGLNDLIISDPAHLHLGGFVSSGVYIINGDPESALQITLTAPGGGDLHLSDFITSEGAPPLLSTALGPDGSLELVIGASLVIDGAAAHPGLDQSIGFTISLVYD